MPRRRRHPRGAGPGAQKRNPKLRRPSGRRRPREAGLGVPGPNLNLRRRLGGHTGDHNRDCEIQQHADRTDALGADSEPPARGVVRLRVHEVEVHDVRSCERDAAHHPQDRPFSRSSLGEDAEDDRGEERRCCEAEGKGNDLSDEPGWIHTEIPRHDHRYPCGASSSQQLLRQL